LPASLEIKTTFKRGVKVTELSTKKALNHTVTAPGVRVSLPASLRTALADREAVVLKVTSR
jgi:hypothetical protein